VPIRTHDRVAIVLLAGYQGFRTTLGDTLLKDAIPLAPGLEYDGAVIGRPSFRIIPPGIQGQTARGSQIIFVSAELRRLDHVLGVKFLENKALAVCGGTEMGQLEADPTRQSRGLAADGTSLRIYLNRPNISVRVIR
jgi:hypothetical protein